MPLRLTTELCQAGLTNHGDGIAAGGILRRTVHGNYINLLADAVKLDADVIVSAGNSCGAGVRAERLKINVEIPGSFAAPEPQRHVIAVGIAGAANRAASFNQEAAPVAEVRSGWVEELGAPVVDEVSPVGFEYDGVGVRCSDEWKYQTAANLASQHVVFEAIAAGTDVNPREAGAVVFDDAPEEVRIRAITVHDDGDVALVCAGEVDYANAFDAAEELTVDDFGVNPAAGHSCADVSDVHATRAVARKDVRDSDVVFGSTDQIRFNRGSGERISIDRKPLDSIASATGTDHAGAPERLAERALQQRRGVNDDRAAITGNSVKRHVLLQLETPEISSVFARRIRGRQLVDPGSQNDGGAHIRGIVDRGIELFNVSHVDSGPSTCGYRGEGPGDEKPVRQCRA
jgi:hypothetical protein